MFNKYMWDTYLNAGGQKTVDVFKNFIEDADMQNYSDTICRLHKCYCPTENITKKIQEELSSLCEDIPAGNIDYSCDLVLELLDAPNLTNEAILRALYNGINTENALDDTQIFEEFSYYLAYYSTLLYALFPETLLPYYFKYNFNVLEKIAQEFEIQLPPIPHKKDYKERLFYYGTLCETLYQFRTEHNMSPYELCAFLYDFAPKYIGGIDSYIINDLPEPKSAFFIGGHKDDAFLSNEPDIVTPWQCNPDTRAGDMIVMYLRSPISAINSVWRSVSVGFNDPFFYYYRCTYIAKPTKIKKTTQKTLERDSVFKKLPIVRKNMQGINGVELYPSVYNHLLDMAKSDLPRLEFSTENNDDIFTIEKDVENKLIKPLLSKLGYNDFEYAQQLYIEIGNHNYALIPDFVILPNKTKGHYSAPFLIEAKLSIPNLAYLEEVKTQARSYAKLLSAKYSVIASKEKIWIAAQNDDYSNDIFSASWNELNNADIFSNLLKLIGKDTIQK